MGYIFLGDAANELAGYAFSSIGDIDGDGLDDLIITAPEAFSLRGEVYVVRAADLAALDEADGTIDGRIAVERIGTDLPGPAVVTGYQFYGHVNQDRLGYSVDVGDFNADGKQDILISAHGQDTGGSNRGLTYLIDGTQWDTLAPGITNIGSLAPQFYTFSGETNLDISSYSLTFAGDMAGDTKADIVIGAPQTGTVGGAGVVYIVPTTDLEALDTVGANDNRIDLADVAANGGYRLQGEAAGDSAGWSLAAGSDAPTLPGGEAHLLIGAHQGDSGGIDSGTVYLVAKSDLAALDAAETGAGTIDLGDVGTVAGYRLIGVAAGDQAGYSVATLEDIDGDGRLDFLIGAPKADAKGTNSGAAYLIRGSDLALLDADDDGVIDLGDVGFVAGLRFIGATAGAEAGISVAAAGDVDRDGLGDLLIGAWLGESGYGAAYLIRGADLAALGPGAQTVDLGDVGSTVGGYRLVGADAGDRAGFEVGSAGDVDNDGRDDIFIGARNAENADGQTAGAAYLLRARHLEAADRADGSDDNVINLSNAPICFVRGTLILTDRGEVPVEALCAGDLLATLDAGLQPIRWIGRTTRPAEGRMAPVRIAAGALGNRRDLLVSPQHRMLLRLADGGEVFAPAIQLVDGGAIRQITGGEVEYFHLMCSRHQVIFAEGAPAESFFPGPQAWRTLSEEARQELRTLFPALDPEAAGKLPGRPGPGPVPGFGPLARPVLRRREARTRAL